MKKHRKPKRITAGITALLMATALSSPLISLAVTVQDNPSGATLSSLAPNETMHANRGTVGNNYGTISYNYGTVDYNNGKVEINNGEVTRNNMGYTITANYGTVNNNDGTVTDNNGEVAINNSSGTITTNSQKVTTNNGTVNTNKGTIQINGSIGTVENNTSVVVTNNGKVTANEGTITINSGTVTTNKGEVATNDFSSVITTNEGTIGYNLGEVTTNSGEVTTNSQRVITNNGTVTTNNATVETNNGTVITNESGVTTNGANGIIITNNQSVSTNEGTITTNNLTVDVNKNTIIDNFGTVNTNEGTIFNNYGTVVADSGIGTVTNRYHEIDLSSTSNVELSVEGYSFKNSKHYVLGEKSVTISPTKGHRIDAPPTVTNGNIADNGDGTYTLSGVTGNTALTVSASPVSVRNILGVPTSMTAGESLTLSGTVEPSDALNQTITWSVTDPGTTGAAINGNVLSADSEGTVVVTATIANGYNYGHFAVDFIMDFTITVSKPVYAVTVIGGTGGTAKANPASASAGTVITLTAAADEGYEFTGWKVTAGTVTLTNPSSPTAAFTMPSSAVTIEASFTPIEDTPTTDTPSGDTPTTDTPSTDTPSGDTPSTDVPSTDAPSGDTPSDDVPSTDTPTTDTPSVQVGRVVIGELTEVPDSLIDKFVSLDELKAAMLSRALMQGGYTEGNTVFYDIKLQISLDGGKTWVAATEDNFPKEGITVKLPYPDGTGSLGHDFAAAHMFTMTSERLGTTAGDVETPQVTELADGLQVTFKGLSPVSVSWRNAEVSNAAGGAMFRDKETTSPKTGDFGAVKVISSAAEKM